MEGVVTLQPQETTHEKRTGFSLWIEHFYFMLVRVMGIDDDLLARSRAVREAVVLFTKGQWASSLFVHHRHITKVHTL